MRGIASDHAVLVPRRLSEALVWLSKDPTLVPLAGGTDLMVAFEAGRLPPGRLLNLWGLKELGGIRVTESHVTLGALVTYSAILASPLLRREFPLLCEAARQTGAIAIQNRGTIGGNVVNASPAADTPPALLVYEAELELCSAESKRWISYGDFHTGYRQTLRRREELVTRVCLPRTARGMIQLYAKVGGREAQAISKVCFAATGRVKGKLLTDVRIALGSVAPVPLRCRRTEEVLRGKTPRGNVVAEATALLEKEISPIDDIRSLAGYRRKVAGNLLRDFLESLPCGTGSRN